MKHSKKKKVVKASVIAEEEKKLDNFMLDEYGKWKVGRAELKSFHRASLSRILESLEKECEGKKEKECYSGHIERPVKYCDDCITVGAVNKTVSDILALITKYKDELKFYLN